MTNLTKFPSRQYNDWRWGGTGVNPPGAPVPAVLSQIGATGVYAWRFVNNAVLALHDLQLDHSYEEGTEIVPHIHFVPETTATYTGTWTLTFVEWLSAATGTAMQTPAPITAAFNAAMTAFQMQSIDFSANLTGLNRKISSTMHALLSLSLSAGSGVFLAGIDGHFIEDSPGSYQITTKAPA